MIGYLQGEVKVVSEERILINTGKVGYAVNYQGAAVDGEDIELYIYTAVKDSDISLWGFRSLQDLKLFELLISVSGVGQKTALVLIGHLGFDQIVSAVVSESPAGLKAPGVGIKTAQRLVFELAGKLEGLNLGGSSTAMTQSGMNQELIADAVDAVAALGYLERDIKQVLSQLELAKFVTEQELIKEILKYI